MSTLSLNTVCAGQARRQHGFRFLKRLATVLLPLLLIGCASQRLHEEGMDLVDQGHVEEGLAKLEAATKSEPENFSYRLDLIRTKDRRQSARRRSTRYSCQVLQCRAQDR